MWRRSNDHKLVNENFHKFLASIARVYPPTNHDEMQAEWVRISEKAWMYVCKRIVPSRQGSTLNNRRASSPLVRLMEKEEWWEASDHPQGVLPQNWGRTKQNRTVTCMDLKAVANDKRTTDGRPDLFLIRIRP
ncbi:uncharacterized protein TNCV_2931761 [Trichonephila clavipes]|nr:uncharacterized protein TNCV_2931761 [Trichonephila clavipes]